MTTESLIVDDLTLEVRRSEQRRTIGLTIDRDGELIVHAPNACPPGRLEQAVRSKQFWIYTKLATKALLAWPPRERDYVTGEGFSYLGRSYRLRLIDADETSTGDHAPRRPLSLTHGRFMLRRSAQADAPDHFRDWYIAHAKPWLQGSVAEWGQRIGVESRGVIVRDLGYRWASCGHSGVLHFNWRTIQLPPRIIEYVVAHELTHLLEPHHDGAFWRALGRAMPDYAERKEWLAQNGGQF